MFLTENQNTKMWKKMLTEQFHVEDQNKLNWVSEYANVHALKESAIAGNAVAGAAGMFTPSAATPGATIPTAPAAAQAAGPGVSPIYATPLNTLGMGNPFAPQSPNPTSTAAGDFFTQAPGSGDIPVSTLPMALNIALLTIGLELVPVIPTKAPWQWLSYMDFPYAGGKMGHKFEITGLDGRGEGRENKPLYFKVVIPVNAIPTVRTAMKEDKLKRDQLVTITTANGAEVKGLFKEIGRMDGGLILEVVSVQNGGDNVSLAEAFEGTTCADTTIDIDGLDLTTVTDADKAPVRVDFAQTMVDFVDGFANFATGKKEGMTRAQNETGTGNVLGLRIFTKFVQTQSYEVTASVTRQQLQDLPLYGVDAVGKLMEACQNEITQSINARILEHVFALGVTNAVKLKATQGADMNFTMQLGNGTPKTLADITRHYVDIFGVDQAATWGNVQNVEVTTSAENLYSRQRRISSRILAASNLIQLTGRRGPATWVVTNAKVVTALQDCSQYVVAPMANTFTQSATANLYKAGTLAGIQVYVDPYMDWDDTRICVGRKGNGNEPGVIFMPYILADKVSIVAEGTMAPKMLVNSRYAIVDAGFYPETMYYTFVVDSDFDWV